MLGDEDTVNAFRLIGFEGYVVGPKELMVKLKELINEQDVVAILVSSSISSTLGQEFLNIRSRTRKPIIMEVPSIVGGSYREVNYMVLLRSTLGL